MAIQLLETAWKHLSYHSTNLANTKKPDSHANELQSSLCSFWPFIDETFLHLRQNT